MTLSRKNLLQEKVIGQAVGATGLEPEPENATSIYEHCGYTNCEMCRAANALHSGRFDWLRLTLSGNGRPSDELSPAVARIAESWPSLPSHIREAIGTLVDASVSSPASRKATKGSADEHDELARRLARQCREVVQSCLREEEWADADREFYDVILEGLSKCLSAQLGAKA